MSYRICPTGCPTDGTSGPCHVCGNPAEFMMIQRFAVSYFRTFFCTNPSIATKSRGNVGPRKIWRYESERYPNFNFEAVDGASVSIPRASASSAIVSHSPQLRSTVSSPTVSPSKISPSNLSALDVSSLNRARSPFSSSMAASSVSSSGVSSPLDSSCNISEIRSPSVVTNSTYPKYIYQDPPMYIPMSPTKAVLKTSTSKLEITQSEEFISTYPTYIHQDPPPMNIVLSLPKATPNTPDSIPATSHCKRPTREYTDVYPKYIHQDPQVDMYMPPRDAAPETPVLQPAFNATHITVSAQRPADVPAVSHTDPAPTRNIERNGQLGSGLSMKQKSEKTVQASNKTDGYLQDDTEASDFQRSTESEYSCEDSAATEDSYNHGNASNISVDVGANLGSSEDGDWVSHFVLKRPNAALDAVPVLFSLNRGSIVEASTDCNDISVSKGDCEPADWVAGFLNRPNAEFDEGVIGNQVFDCVSEDMTVIEHGGDDFCVSKGDCEPHDWVAGFLLNRPNAAVLKKELVIGQVSQVIGVQIEDGVVEHYQSITNFEDGVEAVDVAAFFDLTISQLKEEADDIDVAAFLNMAVSQLEDEANDELTIHRFEDAALEDIDLSAFFDFALKEDVDDIDLGAFFDIAVDNGVEDDIAVVNTFVENVPTAQTHIETDVDQEALVPRLDYQGDIIMEGCDNLDYEGDVIMMGYDSEEDATRAFGPSPFHYPDSDEGREHYNEPERLSEAAYAARNTFLGTVSLEDFIERLALDDAGHTSKALVIQAFASLSNEEKDIMGFPITNSAADAVSLSLSPIMQARVKLGATSLLAFVKQCQWDENGITPVSEIVRVFQHLSQVEQIGFSGKLMAALEMK